MDFLPASFGLICGGFFLLITLAVGVALVLWGARSKKKAGASLQWPATSGTITASEVRQGTNTDEDGLTTYYYFPHVEYSYSIAGQTFNSKQISFGGRQGFNSPTNVQTIVAKYPINSIVQVFYNPQKQAEAVLERVAGGGAKVASIMGIIVLVISAMIACVLLVGVIRNFILPA